MIKGEIYTAEEGLPKRINVADFLSYNNPQNKRYRSLFHDSESGLYGNKHLIESLIFRIRSSEALFQYFNSKARGQLWVDLAGGPEQVPSLQPLVVDLKAAGYMNIDKGLDDGGQGEFVDLQDTFKGALASSGTQLYSVKADALESISRMHNDSVGCVSVVNLDYLVLDSKDYHRACANELARVLKNNGIIFGANSEVLYDLAKDRRFKEEKVEGLKIDSDSLTLSEQFSPTNIDMRIFQKIL